MHPRRWRKLTWVLNFWNLLFLVWVIGTLSSRPSLSCAANDPVCKGSHDFDTGVALVVELVLWFVGFVVISLVWLMTRPPPAEGG